MFFLTKLSQNKIFYNNSPQHHPKTSLIECLIRACSILNYLKESGEHKDYSRYSVHFCFWWTATYTFKCLSDWIVREELVEFWSPIQCSAKPYPELEEIDENGPMVQKFLDQQKGFLDQQGKGDLGLLYMDDDEDYDEEDYK